MRFFLFLFTLSLFSQDLSLVVTENDPSTLVEGVSVITGDLYSFAEDYVVQGAKPISVPRSYLSREGGCRTFSHLYASFLCLPNLFCVSEPNGTNIYYYADSENKWRPEIGEDFFGKREKPLRYHALAENNPGVANTKTGEISGRTNIENQYLLLLPRYDDKGKTFTLYAADGTVRRYGGLKHQEKCSASFLGGSHPIYLYKLLSETKPDGHQVHYHWNEQNQLVRISTTNRSGTKEFAYLDLPVSEQFLPEATFKGSDGRSLTYKSHPTPIKNLYVTDKIAAPDLPEQRLDWEIKKIASPKSYDLPLLQGITLPSNRTVQVGYEAVEDPTARAAHIRLRLAELEQEIASLKSKAKQKEKYRKKREQLKHEKDKIANIGVEGTFAKEYIVRTLSSPVGPDGKLHVTHTFCYDQPHKNSYVLDAEQNKTAYFWNDDYRLTQILHYQGQTQVLYGEKFIWEKSRLKGKVHLDHTGVPLFAYRYSYDTWGNIEEEIFYGSLSGEKTPPLQLGTDGLPLPNGVETHRKKFRYSQDGRHLLLEQEEGDLRIQYTYRPDAHLLVRKSIGEREKEHIVYTYEYDEDLLLVKESVQDSFTHSWKKITPRQESPYIGLPEIIEEYYRDTTGDNTLLKKTVLHYGLGATLQKKEIYDATGQHRYTLNMTYDDKGRLVSETNPLGQTATYRYDSLGNRIYAQDFTGRLETFYAYDNANRLTKKEERGTDGTCRPYLYAYDTKHNLVAETDPYQNVTTSTYDALGRRTALQQPPLFDEEGRALPSTTHFVYDSAGHLVQTQDPAGHTTYTTYNAYGKPLQITHPDGAVESFTYYLNGQLKTATDPTGVVTSYIYDYLGRVISKKTADAEESFTYVGQHLTEKKDAEGYITRYTYDAAGRKLSEERAQEISHYTYDALGRLHTTQKGELLQIIEYDLLDRPLEERTESLSGTLLRKVTYAYDPTGQTKTITRFLENGPAQEVLTYDAFGRLLQKTDALGSKDLYTYDPYRNQKTYTDAEGLKTCEEYNAQNLLVSLEKQKGDQTLSRQQKYYDPNGKLTLQIDTLFAPTLRNIRTRWEYNSRQLLQTLVEAEGTPEAKITRYTYTPRGELATVLKPSGVLLTYTYSSLGFLLSLTSSDGTVDHQMTYNRLGHLQTAGSLMRTTDPFGRLLTEIFPGGYRLENTYNASGQRTSCKIPAANCLLTYTYDPLQLKTLTRHSLDGTPLYTHTYTQYDLAGHLLSQELIYNQGTVHYTYDPLGRPTALTAPSLTQEIRAYDKVGNIAQMTLNGDLLSYTYDPLYQLTQETQETGLFETQETGLFAHTYTYDALYNRLSKDEESYTLNPLNQIPSHLTYDANGNPLQYGTTRYTYDALDRLIRLETPTFTQTFTYDSLHRCLSQLTTDPLRSAKLLYFLYDGQNEIGSLDRELNPLELRLLGPTPHAERGAAVALEFRGQPYVPLHDLQGNLAALWLPNHPTTLYRYSAFGEEKIFGQPLSPWRFCSKRTDQRTQLVNFGRRYYLPALGRWLTPDPAGFADGMNLYAYVHNDPLTHIDDYGLLDFGQYSPDWNKPSPFWNTRAGADVQRYRAQARTAFTNAWHSPHTQGAWRAVSGMAEASAGAALLSTPFAPFGTALLIRGADRFSAGAYTLMTGRPTTTITSQLLQTMGMGRERANRWDDHANFLATLGAGGVAYKLGREAIPFYLSTGSRATLVNGEIRFSVQSLTTAQEKNLFSSAVKAYDRNLTQLAHSFSKHAGRHPENWGRLKGPMNTWHDQAFNQLKHIYNAPGEFKTVIDAKTKLTWIEKRLPDGRGIRLNQDYTFKGFLD